MLFRQQLSFCDYPLPAQLMKTSLKGLFDDRNVSNYSHMSTDA